MNETQIPATIDLSAAEAAPNPETAWANEVYERLADLRNADILVDVDSTIYQGNTDPDKQYRPGTVKLLADLRANGNRIHLWSTGSGEYAESIATHLGLAQAGLIDSYHDKPTLTKDAEGKPISRDAITLRDTVELVGFTPAATIDDMTSDKIIDAPDVRFVLVEQYLPPKARQEVLQPA